MSTIPALADKALRDDFPVFVQRAFHHLYPNRRFDHAKHILAICHKLDRVLAAQEQRLLITAPPRHLKSFIASVCFPAYALGHEPSLKILCISYSAELAEGFARDTREIMQADWYRRLFLGTCLIRTAVEKLETTAHGFRAAKSMTGSITGSGGDIIILDDPLNAGAAASEAERKTANDTYADVITSRLDDAKIGAKIVLAQRLHIDDLPGQLIAQGGWGHLDFPVTAYLPQTIEIAPGKFWHRSPGDILHPERFGVKEIAERKREIGTAAYSAQYDQRPVPPEGHIFKLEWFPRYQETEFECRFFELIVQSWDTALATNENANYSACTTWGIRGRKSYLLHAYRDRLGYTDLKRKLFELREKFHAGLIIVEYAASGIALTEDLQEKPGNEWFRCISNSNHDSKVARAEHQTAKIERGEVLLPASRRSWTEQFELELTAFPHSKHDDWVDSMTQFLRTLDYSANVSQLRELSRFRGQ
jgi:predicted phage terminase large subunit-like protein